MRGAELDPMRGAGEEGGVRSSARCAVRGGRRSAKLGPVRGAEEELGMRSDLKTFSLEHASVAR